MKQNKIKSLQQAKCAVKDVNFLVNKFSYGYKNDYFNDLIECNNAKVINNIKQSVQLGM